MQGVVVDLGVRYTNVQWREQVYNGLKAGVQSEEWGVCNLLQTGRVSKSWRVILLNKVSQESSIKVDNWGIYFVLSKFCSGPFPTPVARLL